MKLQILIPQYRETDDVIRPLLDSIAIQQNVDFSELGVIIYNDGTNVHLSKALMDSYKFHIEYWRGEHKGVSGTRNALMDLATADYIMFCDADDMFLSVCGLYLLMRYIDEGFDVFYSAFFEETRDMATGEPLYITRDNDATFVHGKAYRREYLIEKGLRWNEDLTVHEDSYFNGLCINTAENVRYCEDAFYLWKWRDESVCRNDEEYRFATYTDLIASYDALVGELITRGFRKQAVYYVCYAVFETYYTMNKPEWQNVYREKTEKRFGQFFTKWKDLWESATDRDKLNISETIRSKHIKEGMGMETFTLSEWLEKGENHGKQKSQREKTAGEGRSDAGTARTGRSGAPDESTADRVCRRTRHQSRQDSQEG